ncbi:MAG: proline racemase family protein [Beijerinckiaceae bacterium]
MRVIDSHTGGEPTRIIIAGGPDLGTGPLAERRAIFARDFDHIRSFTVNEPRGHDAIVGALLCEPVDKSCVTGVIFFNNVGMIGMCGHGTIGLAVTLAHLGRIGPGLHRVETPVGIVTFELLSAHEARITNVPAYRYRKAATVQVPGMGPVTGDIAWGGNWFFLTEHAPCALTPENIPQLTRDAQAMLDALHAQKIDGDGAPVDHIEIFGPPSPGADSRSFVLCPGGAYDRSPCGTGTSAKLACLAADGKLKPGTPWIQESIIGSRFSTSYEPMPDGSVSPTITGSAYITADATLIGDGNDPFRFGIGASVMQRDA